MSQKLVERLQQEFGSDILATGSQKGDESITVAPEKLSAVLTHLRSREGCEQLSDVVGVDYPEREKRFEVNYLMRSWRNNHRVIVKTDVEEGASVPTATGIYHSANWHEREVYDLFGVRFAGHPDLRRILCHHQFEGHALRKDYEIERGQECSTPEKLFSDEDLEKAARRANNLITELGGVVDEIYPSDLLTVNLGPSHPAMHGALRAEVLLDGETILDSKTEIGYIHRCFEKEAEDHTWAAIMPYTDRLNYCSAMTNNSIYASAVEKMLGVEITPRAQAVRVIVSELGRIIDHLVCICANLVDVGALTNYWYLYNVRESIYHCLEKLCGSRLTTNYARIGGMSHDLYDGFEAEIRERLDGLVKGTTDVMNLVSRNRIFLDRTVDVGVISQEDALSFGYTGPCLRATGLAYDLRKHAPYWGYDQYDFDIPVGSNGDTHDRIMVRMAELVQSRRIVLQALDKLPGGPINVDDHAVILPPKEKVYGSIEGVMNQFKLIYEGIKVPAGEGYGFGEGANGELGFFCVSDGSGHPYRMKVRPPCFPIFSAFSHIIQGGMVPDAIATLGSLNIIAGELDR
ncbi:NADH-quinone oxidoreductase subunit NuoD [bacterium DOLZORAL124_64_63]|nr:MAG: NADH-quinone oxidoreductase subunit NuoD [bacterium DOLZORAL124_64_63]